MVWFITNNCLFGVGKKNIINFEQSEYLHSYKLRGCNMINKCLNHSNNLVFTGDFCCDFFGGDIYEK